MSEPPSPYRVHVTCSICGREVEADPAEQEAARQVESEFGLPRPAFICEHCAWAAESGTPGTKQ